MDTPLPYAFTLPVGSLDTILTIIFLILVIVFMVHTAIVAYHWITYAKNRSQAYTAVLLHAGIGVMILLGMGAIILF